MLARVTCYIAAIGAARAMAAQASTPHRMRASCYCGAVHVVVADADAATSSSICHCSVCRRLSGAPFLANVLFKRGNVALETADGAAVDAAAPIASTAAERDLFVRRAAAAPKPAARRRPSAPPAAAPAAAAPAAPPPAPGPAVPCEGAPLANVFVVTLARDDARVRHTETYTRRRLPEAEVFDAVDGASPALAAFLRSRAVTLAPAWAKACTVGQLGCMCSHMALWRKVVDDGLDHAIVLEDDVLVADGFRTEVANILGELPALWDHCYLFHHPQCKRDLPLAGAKHVQRAFETWGTVAYVVSRSGAKKLLARTEGASCAKAIDETMMGLVRDGELNSYLSLIHI